MPETRASSGPYTLAGRRAQKSSQDREPTLQCLAVASPAMFFPMASADARQRQWEFSGIDDDDFDTSSLHAHVIKSPSRELLLSRHRRNDSFELDPSVDATSLLTDLSRLAPAVAKDFVPKIQGLTPFIFRLINDVEYRGETTGYIAMSYCWQNLSCGTPRKTKTPLGDLPFAWTKEVEQFPLPTSSTVFQAVLRERRPGEGLWLDQVCINQDDEREKVAAMSNMDTIYSNARTVVVALDDITIPPEEEQFLKPYIDLCTRSEWSLPQHPNIGTTLPFMSQYPVLHSFVERVLSSEWFDRAWCAQEMRMGQSHVFILPVNSLYEDGVSTVLRFTSDFFLHLLLLASEVQFTMPMTHVRIRSLLRFFQERVPKHESTSLAVRTPVWAPAEKSIIPIIAATFQMKAGGDPRLPEYLRRLDANRDRMCIALNMAGIPLALTASNPFSRPNIEAECLRSLLLVGLAARDPVALCTTGPPLQLHDGSVSWLCRPSSLDLESNKPSPPRFPQHANQFSHGSDGRAEFAQLDLIFLELPHRTQPNPLYPQHVARARTYIDLCSQYRLDGGALWNFWQTPGNPRASAMRNMFIQTFACMFDLGAQWCLDVSLQMQQVNMPLLEPQALDMLLNPHLIIHNYLQLPDGQTALSDLLKFASTLIASGMPWASGATEPNYGPMIISAPVSDSSFDLSTPSPTFSSRAIIFAPFEHSKTLLIAVPAAVKDAPYTGLARGWILTSMNPHTGSPRPIVSWTLQSKGVVFGDGNFTAALARTGASDVRHHRVYGPSQQ